MRRQTQVLGRECSVALPSEKFIPLLLVSVTKFIRRGGRVDGEDNVGAMWDRPRRTASSTLISLTERAELS
jgi:hypothetical protein